MADSPIAVTGCTGTVGKLVAHLLAERGVRQRLIARDPSRAPNVPNSDVARADYSDHQTIVAALSGVDTVFFVSAHEDPARVQQHETVVAAMAEAGVRRVVYTSFLGAAPWASFTFAREHCATEHAMQQAGLSVTALRNTMYADLVPYLVGDDDVLRGPGGDGRVAWVAREDIARLAVETLCDDTHADNAYDVTGPQSLTLDETARVLSEMTGRSIRYHPETEEEARAWRKHQAGEYFIDGWIGSYLGIATGELAVVSHTVEHVTGTRPKPLRELLAAGGTFI